MASYRGEYATPSQMDWGANLRGLNSSGSSVRCFVDRVNIYDKARAIGFFREDCRVIYTKRVYNWKEKNRLYKTRRRKQTHCRIDLFFFSLILAVFFL